MISPVSAHPMTIELNQSRVVVRVFGCIVADSREALVLRESGYAVVHYIPRKDIDMRFLRVSSHESYSAFKGRCVFYDVVVEDSIAIDGAWSYAEPSLEAIDIRDHFAFYSARELSITLLHAA